LAGLNKQDFENKHGEILGMGSRIIPMSQDILGELGKEICFTNCCKNGLEALEDYVNDFC
jgi:hypothetical protein